jgi:threonine dehydrogenase-like Zn-dependent dehydrogenase
MKPGTILGHEGVGVVEEVHEDSVKGLIDLRSGIGVDRAIDAVGVVHAYSGPASEQAKAGALSIIGVYPQTAAGAFAQPARGVAREFAVMPMYGQWMT